MSDGLATFLQLSVSGAALGAIYGLVALGLVLVWNSASMINFAQGDFPMLGAFVAISLTDLLGGHLVPATALALLVAAAAGVAFAQLVHRPLAGNTLLAVLIGTIGVSTMVRNLSLIIWGTAPRFFPPLFGTGILQLGKVRIPHHNIGILAVTALLIAVQVFVFQKTTVGRMIRATAQDTWTARLLGIPTIFILALTFAYSAFLGGVAGILMAPTFFVQAFMGNYVLLKAFCATVIGGWGSAPGAMLGGILLGLSETLVTGYISDGYKDVIAFVILVIFLLVRPTGLMGVGNYERA